MNTFSSVDYANLLKYLAFSKYKVNLNKTQVNKLLFMCYGFYMSASKGKMLFQDDTPKAWPYGPVFPRVFKRYNNDIPLISPSQLDDFKKDELAYSICEQIIDKYSLVSAYDLSMWSHKEGGPWYKTIKENKIDGKVVWGKEINKDNIKCYFTK